MVAVVRNHRNEILVALRKPDSHQGGLWEFPGGKREPGEPPLQALHRELREETGLRILASHPLCRVEHRYSDKHVLLDVHLVTRWSASPQGTPTASHVHLVSRWTASTHGTPTASPHGTPTTSPHLASPYGNSPYGPCSENPAPGSLVALPRIGPEGQPLDWRGRHDLRAADFPAANAGIVRLLRLPDAITITPECAAERDFLELMRKLIEAGRELVQVRQPQLSPVSYRGWFLAALNLAEGSRTRLLFNNPPEHFDAAWPGCGLHASSRVLDELADRPVPPERLFSASCHSLAELRRAEALGADFALLSPVLPTAKHTSGELLGWRGFRRLADTVSLPVYALGGLSPELAPFAHSQGAFGVAGISGFAP